MKAGTSTESIPASAYRLSPVQEQIWAFHRSDAVPCLQCSYAIRGCLDAGRLRDAIGQAVSQYEILRTVYRRLPGMAAPFQIILDNSSFGWEATDLSQLPDTERQEELSKVFVAQKDLPFDLEQGPVLRAVLAKLDPDRSALVLSLPALSADLPSLDLLAQAITRFYAAVGDSEEAAVEAMQYADISEWQHELLESEDSRPGREFWRNYLRVSGDAAHLPFERAVSDSESFAPEAAAIPLTADARSALIEVASLGTLPDFLLTGWQILLWRLIGHTSVTVAASFDGRRHEELRDCIGPLSRFLPVCSEMDSFADFGRTMTTTRETRHEIAKWQDAFRPGGGLAEKTDARPFLFDYIETAPICAGGLTLSLERICEYSAPFRARLLAIHSEQGIDLELHWDSRRYSRETMTAIAEYLAALIGSAAAQPAKQIGELEILSEAARHRLTIAWNQTSRRYDETLTFPSLFELQAERTPDRPAVATGDRQLTYRELNERASQVAHRLHSLGAGPDSLVAVCLDRSVELMVAILGILKSGAAYVPLNPDTPRGRLALQLTAVAAVITEEPLLSRLPEFSGSIVCLDRDAAQLSQLPGMNPTLSVTGSNLAYVIFTSGSTGVPKGVQIEHHSLANYSQFIAELLDLQNQPDGLRFATVSTIAADLGNTCIFPALISGGTVHLISYDTATDAARLAAYVQQHQIDVLKIVPSHLSALLAAQDRQTVLPKKFLILGGEALSPKLLESVRFLHSGCRIINHYGPTETTVGSLTLRLDDYDPLESQTATIPIGRPIANTRVYILDARLRPVPPGVVGELYIGGAGIARGYLNQPELTAERFIPDSFSQEPDARLYRTGDLARFLPNGTVEFLGRADDQVKIRGFRIELGEIEGALASHPAVKQAIVLARDNGRGEKQLVAYLVAHRGMKPEPSAMRTHLKEQLPDYMLPSAFVALDKLPLNANGKIDRTALPSPEAVEKKSAWQGPRTPVEEMVADIWAEILRLDRIGIHDDFFQAGGHSLLATQVVSRLRRTLNVEVPLRAIFDASTVARFAEHLERERLSSAGIQALPMVPVSRNRDLQLSFAQHRLWFLHQLEPESPLYNIPRRLRLTGPLNLETLAAALNDIVRRHETLRTTFAIRDGEPVQRIAPHSTVELPVLDLSSYPEQDRESEARFVAREEGRCPFSLAEGPLLRIRLLRLAEEDHVLLLTMHHIVSDGWSSGIFLDELCSLYQKFSAGEPCPLPELPIQYADFAAWQREFLSGEVLERQLEYWKRQLGGAPAALDLPTDRPRPAMQTFAGTDHSVVVPWHVLDGLKELSRKEGVTLFMTTLGAVDVLLARYSGQPDIVVGSPIAGRNRSELEGLIGFFANTLALRADLSGEPAFTELLNQVRETAMGAYAHQDLPFEKLVEELNPVRDMSRSPIFQVVLSFQNAPRVRGEIGNVTLSGFSPLYRTSQDGNLAGEQTAKFDLTVALVERPDGLASVFQYNTDLFDGTTIERMARHWQALLEGIVASPGEIVSRIPLLGEAERRQLLVDWNGHERIAPSVLVHEGFELQAARQPNAIAVSCEDRSLTYKDLNQRANRLARFLRRRGLGPDSLAAIYLPRDLEIVTAILAILKAGGAYLPLDPAYPADRLRFMLDDARPAVLLTVDSLRSELPPTSSEIVCLDSAWERIAQEDDSSLPPLAGPDNLIYVIYTSGSTGRPKGTLVTHANVARLFAATEPWFGFGPEDVWTLFHSCAFDFSVWELWGALLYGGRLVVVPYLVSRSPQDFYQLLQREQVTVLNQTPSSFQQLIQVEHSAAAAGALALRYVIFGGEALDLRSLKPWFTRHGDRKPRLVNMYGITETTVHVTYRPLHIEDTDSGSVIGCPIPDLRLYLLDRHLLPAPIGVAGEMYVGGGGVARGYLNRPELTAERFLDNPFEPGGRLYRTGDRARWLASGDIEYLGRIDDQVKIRGFRIELGEIEAQIAGFAGIRQTVVLAREDTPGDKRLVAYVVTENGDTVSPLELRESLKQRLPEYMLPAAFVFVPEIPLTGHGKVDRRALPAPDAGAYASREYEPPQGAVETKLAQIWAEVLRTERVGRHDNFFELGGHSFLAVTLIERMRQAGFAVDVRALFLTPTVAELAAGGSAETVLVEVPPNLIPPHAEAITPEMLPLIRLSTDEIERIVGTVPGGAANVQDLYPLAPLQEGILFHHLIAQEGDPYLLAHLMAFTGRERLDAYLRAMQAVIDRHDILRTAIVWEGLPEPVQVVWRQASLPVEEVQFDAAADDIAGQLYARFDPRRHRIDVRRAPMLRGQITYDPAEDRWLLLLLTHHLIDDATSMRKMREEIQTFLRGQTEQLPAPMPFRNLVAQARLGSGQQEHEAFFRQMLGDVEEPTAPFGVLDVQGDATAIDVSRILLDLRLALRLRERARALRVSSASLCHLAWAQVLSRLSGRDDVVFGTVLFGRMQGGAAADRVMGLFINTLPLRIRLGSESAESSLRSTHALLVDLLRHEHASLALAQRCSAVAAPAPLFSALLNYRHGPGISRDSAETAEQSWDGISWLRADDRTNYPLTFSIDDLGEGFRFKAQTVAPMDPARICGYMRTALESLVEALEWNPAAPVCSLQILPQAEHRQLLVEWNGHEHIAPSVLVHEGFEFQAARQPDGIAVSCEDRSLTYKDLSQRANRLARFLRRRGLGPDSLAAIYLPRDLEIVTAILAILKAGGAYLPLDPAYPADRLRFMLDDARPAVLLTVDSLRSELPPTSSEIVCLDSAWERIAQEDDSSLPPLAGPDNLIYVIYTSGSTGRPKGTLVTHANVARLFAATEPWFGFGPEDVWTLFHSCAFDFSVWELWGALLYGGRLVVVPYLVSRSPQDFYQLLQREQVTVLNQTPSSFQQLIQVEESGGAAELALRYVIFGGEALDMRSLKPWFTRHGDEKPRLVNMYGITETTVHVTYRPLHIEDTDSGSVIGCPIPDLRLYLLDRHLLPAPIGVAGEMYVGGGGVARGYLNRPELTAERFLDNPFEPGGRLYRTGDRARWLASGDIEYLGRIDDQVKIRGFRIELGEIEARLAEHPGVRDALVLAREDVPGEKRLVAYFVPEEDAGEAIPDAQQLRESLTSKLPEYMIPAAFVRLPALPLTQNGKLDRKALPAPETDAYARRGYEAPRNETEDLLAKIWTEVLRVERVGRYDNFFELGGHSLLAVILIERMRRAGLQTDVRALFAAPTLAGLAATLDAAASQIPQIEIPPNRIPPDTTAITPEMLPLINLTSAEIARIVSTVPGGAVNVQDIYPLAPLQEGILFHHLMSTEGDPYLLASEMSFDTRDRLDAYLHGLQTVVDRHDILRTSIVWEGLPEPVQVVWRRAQLPVEEVQLDPQTGDIDGQLYARFDPRHTRLDVRQAPLLRAYIARDPIAERWLMMMMMHHLVDDATSMRRMREEIQACMAGKPEQLPPVVPFRNLVAQARLGISREEHEAFFRQMLGDIDEPTAPFGFLDVRGDGAGLEEAQIAVNEQLAWRVREQARRQGVVVGSLLHLAWAQVLARICGREDVVFGTVLFGRMQGGVEAGIGPFINTLPVRVHVGDDSAESGVRHMHRRLSELLRHEHASLALAQRCSAVAAPAPLFSTVLNCRRQRSAAPGEVSGEVRLAWEGVRRLRLEERTNYPFMLSVDDFGQGFRLTALSPAEIGPMRICEYVQTALEALVEALESEPSRALRTLEILPAAERRHLLDHWNDTAVPAEPRMVYQLFKAQAELSPSHVAVTCGSQSLSYDELNRRASQLARHLRALGVAPGSLAGIFLDRSPDLLVAMLAVHKAGAAYVPLDPSYPPDRLAFMLADSGLGIVITHSGLAASLPSQEVRRLELDRAWDAIAAESSDHPGLPVDPERLAYVRYTSGSTGRPKGVMVPHRAVVNFLQSMRRQPGISSQDALLAVTTLSFDISELELWLPLCAGARVVLATREQAADGLQLLRLLASSGATLMQATPATWRLLLESGWSGSPGLTILCGGEALPTALVSDLLPRCRALWNMYGPTETTIWSAVSQVTSAEAIFLGPPIANTQFYILDRHGNPAPLGVPGELCIGGDGLAHGYLNRPELTEEKFIPNPFRGEPPTQTSAHLYRTGDLVRRRSSGEIEFLGRIDQQVKIRGFRIELGEIEAQIERYPGVRQAVALAREDTPGDKRLVAYLVLDDSADASVSFSLDALRSELRQKLPDYMVPAAFVVLPQIPLSPAGKVDRKALPAPDYAAELAGRPHLAPRSPVEEVIAGIWEQVLQIDSPGIEDNFFDRGGHSLLATQVISRIRQAFAVELPLRALFEGPSIAQLAQNVQALRRQSHAPAVSAIKRVSRKAPLALSFAQQRLWFLDQLEPGSPFYNMPRLLRLAGHLDTGALQFALDEVVRRHEVLRTTFPVYNGEPLQVIAPVLQVPLPVTDLTSLPGPERETEAHRLAAEEIRAPFDLAHGPLLRARLLRLTEEDHVLILNLHHIVSDGWSQGILMRELTALYTARTAGQPYSLPELPIQYADFAAWQRDFLSGETLERQMGYWKEKLAGAPPSLDLPTDRPRPAMQTFRGARRQFALSKSLSDELKRLSRAEGATLFMTVLAAFGVLLSRYSGQEDIVIGTPIAGRNRAETEPLVGLFVNTLVLRTDLSGAPGFRQLLPRVRETAMDAYASQDVPFEKLVEELNPVRDLSRNPLAQVELNLFNLPASPAGLPGTEIRPFPIHSQTTKYDLSCSCVETSKGTQIMVDYGTDLFDASSIERMFRHWQTLLEGIAASPDCSVGLLPLLGETERQQILCEWNATSAEYGPELMHELFALQAERTPDTPALTAGDEQLTYGELNFRTNQLAHALREIGIGAESLVGVCMSRSLQMPVALLGTLKAGAAYVPIDPSWPEQRVRFMLEDSNVSALLTEARLIEVLPFPPCPVLALDADGEDWRRISAGRADIPVCAVQPENLAYVIYTSGSTGQPKGAQVLHRGLSNYLQWCTQAYRLGSGDVVPLHSSISFDLTVTSLLAPLVAGATVELIPEEGGVEALAVALRSGPERALVKITPAHLELLSRQLAPEQARGRVRSFVIGGENLLSESARFWLDHAPGTRFINEYGPTETVVGCCVHEVNGGDLAQASIPIGRPIANTQLYVLDANRQPVPIGVAGELYIGGAGVARGYLNRPELTSDKFIPDPFRSETGAHLYRTGDMARYLPDGKLEFLGRTDHQVKIRGYRIELGEIESRIGQFSGVRATAVIVREDVPGDKRLVAYCVPESAQPLEIEALRACLKESLPDYMVPSAFVLMGELPLTPGGKIDRKALPRPERDASPGDNFVAPRTPAEDMLCAIWAEVLRLGQVGTKDDFFSLGGHSLLATQVTSRIRQTFHVELPLRQIFQTPTIAALAAHVEILQRHRQGIEIPAIPVVSRENSLPLSFAQQRLWFLNQLEPASAFYNVPVRLRLRGGLDAHALERALREIVRRHEVLRTSFRVLESEEEPVQIIAADLPVGIEAIDLTEIPEAQREMEARRVADERAHRPFDLTTGPVFRAALLRLDEKDHVLLIEMHHIATDGWSLPILLKELNMFYSAFMSGTIPALPALPIQYADFAAWQRSFLSGETLHRQMEYWKEKLAGAPPSLDLPTDRPRPAMQTFRGARQQFVLSKSLSDEVERLGRTEGVTLFMTVLSAFDVLLSRYSGQEDIVIGTPIAGRNRAETEPLIGFFVNTLVLRTDLSGAPTFRQILARVRETAMDAYASQDVPFEKLVEELNPARDLSRSPLFQVMLILQNLPAGGGRMADLEVSSFAPGGQSSKFDLSLIVTDLPSGMRADLEYNSDLFDEDTIARMGRHWQNLLAAIAADPERPIGQFSLLDAEEQQFLLTAGNKTAVESPNACVHQLVEAQAALTPERVAVSLSSQSLSYDELNRRASQLARHLRALGVAPGSLAGIFLDRSPDLLVAMLAVHKAGAAYVPLDPSYPPDRLAFMLADSGLGIVITHSGLAASLPSQEVRRLELDRAWDAIAAESSDHPGLPVDPERLAYVRYTSGSTGRPKGVMVPHRAVVNFLQSMRRQPGISSQDALLAVTTLSFDISELELWLPLCAGARVVLATREQAADGLQLLRLLASSGATLMQATPATWRLLLESGWSGSPGLTILCGGEALPTALVSDLLPRCRALWNMYGPTETTIWSAVSQVTSAEAIFLGPPIANTQFYILDRHGNPAPLGVPGELCIGGDGLAHGYLNRPELTEEKFIPNPFRGEPPTQTSAHLYRTGDLVRRRSSGEIEFLGRIDQQVKIRGFRIELGEIEAQIERYPGVRQAVALAREDTPGDKRLVAYLVLDDSADASVSFSLDALRSELRQKLPDYMVPAAFVVLPQIPLSPAGKVDRKALPAPDYAAELAGRPHLAPRSPVEEVIAGIWEQVLQIDSPGIEDNFFDRGGHSLLATQVISRIRQAFAVELPLRALFEGPSIAQLAQNVQALRRQSHAPAVSAIKRVSRKAPLALSFAQQRLWFLDQLEPGSPFYNMPRLLRLAGHLDTGALQFALDEVVRRHEVLRTTFPVYNGEPLQVIAPVLQVPLPVTDLTSLPGPERETEAHRLAAEEIRAPFDLAHGPLLRARLLRLTEEDHVLILNLHHIVSDGWSQGILMRELTALYTARTAGQPYSLPELPIQYADFAAWQRDFLSGETLEQQLEYWKRQLAGAPAALDLPTDRPRPAMQTFHGSRHQVVISKPLRDELKQLSYAGGATLFMTVLSAFDVLLSRYSGQEDIVIGTPIAGRNRAETEPLVGLFVNTLVLRTDLSGAPSFRQLLGDIREAAMDAYASQDVPFEKLVEELNPARDLSRSPLFQVMLILQNLPAGGGRMADLEVSSFAPGGQSSKFDLSLIVTDLPSGMRADLEYNSDLFDEDTIARMGRHWQNLLAAIAADPERPIGQFSLLDAEEQQFLLTAGNKTAVESPNACVHQLVEAQAALTPERVAVSLSSQSLSYDELNRRASQLARHLRALGVAPGSLAGIFLDRSPDLLVAMLAVHKAGAAYVPLDPSYPPDRLAFMLADSGLGIVITHSGLAASLPSQEVRRLELDRAWDAIAAESSDHPGLPVDPERLAYVRYTSGSTGRPKGVMVPHRAVVNFLQSMRRQPGISSQDALLAVTTLSFDISELELWLPLCAGARVVLATREQAADGLQLLRLLASSGATLMQATPATWRLLLESGWSGSPGLTILCGGEALPTALVSDLLPRCRALWNMYGPTETTIWSAVSQVTSAEAIFLGPPIANTQFYILDRHGNPAPLGVPGELCIGGDGLAHGYLNRPELTEEKFIPNPFRGEPPTQTSAHLYRTGDLVRRRSSGEIEFLGRIDQQVKIRGFRIELGEIEAQIERYSGVRQAVALAREDTPGDKRLVAYLVLDDSADASVSFSLDALRSELRQKLPDYMVPAAFVVLPQIPLSPAGKVDRKALPAPQQIAHSTLPSERPTTAIELRVAEIFEEVLNVRPVGLTDDFFDLGGHSLLAVRLTARLRETFGHDVPLAVLFRASSVRDLGRLLREEGGKYSMPVLIPIRATGSRPPLFCVSRPNTNALGFLFLTRRLSEDQPVYGLQSTMKEDEFTWTFSQKEYEEKAREYIDAMRQVQPSGPYFLTGFCEGSHIAFEMARQLEAMNLEVGMISILDTFPLENTMLRRRYYLWKRLLALRALTKMSREKRWRFLRRKLGLDRRPANVSPANGASDRRDSEARRSQQQRMEERFWPGPDWKPPTYPGKLILFRSSYHPYHRIRDPRMGWDVRALGGVEVIPIPGDHWLILREPNVQVLAKQMDACIERILKERTEGHEGETLALAESGD